MIAGILAVAILLSCVAWLGFSFWVGGIVKDRTRSDGLATLVCLGVLFTPLAFVIGVILGG